MLWTQPRSSELEVEMPSGTRFILWKEELDWVCLLQRSAS